MTRIDSYRTAALVDVINERFRQVEVEGFDAAHDDAHDAGEISGAAAAYALNAACELHPFDQLPLDEPPPFWLWDASWWKPKGARRDLVRAAALCIAEIERIDREAARKSEAA